MFATVSEWGWYRSPLGARPIQADCLSYTVIWLVCYETLSPYRQCAVSVWHDETESVPLVLYDPAGLRWIPNRSQSRSAPLALLYRSPVHNETHSTTTWDDRLAGASGLRVPHSASGEKQAVRWPWLALSERRNGTRTTLTGHKLLQISFAADACFTEADSLIFKVIQQSSNFPFHPPEHFFI